jgi:hypothetical protein
MATKVLYSAAMPTKGEAITKAPIKHDGIVPYFVSGPLHREIGLFGALGATLHVAAWIVALVMDIMLLGKIDGGKDSDAVAYDFILASFVPLIVGLAVIVLTTLLHALTDTYKVPEGGLPPFMMTIITGGAVACLIFAFLLVQYPSAGLYGYTKHSTAATPDLKKAADFSEAFRRLALWGLLAKIFIVQFVQNNQIWASGADNAFRASK